MDVQTFSTPALAAYAAGRPLEPIGFLPNGRAVYPIAGGAEDVVPAGASLPSADDLQGMEVDALEAHRTSVEEEARDLQARDDADLSDGDVDRLEALADHLDAIDAEGGRRDQIATERSERAQAARDRLSRDPEAEDGAEDPAGEDPAVDPEAEAPAPSTEDAPAAPEAVAAGGSRVPARRPAPRPAARRNPVPADRAPSAGYSLVAAADVGGRFAAGSPLGGMADAAEAFVQRSKGFPQGPARSKNVRHQHQVASIERVHPDGLTHSNRDFVDIASLLREAANESRLSGQSLVAAGGWCAPSETMYGLTSMETLDGILDLPTIGVDRGGINYTPGPDFSDIYATAGFHQTEAEAIAGTEKPCVEIDCPDFTEVRLDAVGHCVKAPLLTRTAYPEVIQRWLEGTLIANQHKVAARIVTAMRNSLGTALAPVLTGTPVTWSLLTILELVIEGQRQAYRLGESETLEVKAPRWLRVAIRADLANRAFVGAASVSNAQIAEHFADRGAVIDWILNYQELANPKTNVAFPSTVEVMVYPAGTFVRGNADVISLDTVYDTADLQTNVYTAAFVEDGVLVAKMQHGGARITLPVNVTGQMGALNLSKNWGTSQAA